MDSALLFPDSVGDAEMGRPRLPATRVRMVERNRFADFGESRCHGDQFCQTPSPCSRNCLAGSTSMTVARSYGIGLEPLECFAACHHKSTSEAPAPITCNGIWRIPYLYGNLPSWNYRGTRARKPTTFAGTESRSRRRSSPSLIPTGASSLMRSTRGWKSNSIGSARAHRAGY
jgi:hypothetical protein